MNSTSRRAERHLRRLWRKKIRPAAEAARARGVDVLDPTSPDDESWFVAVPAAETGLVEIESDQVAERLADIWNRRGLHELAAVAPDIAKEARRMRGERSDNTAAELSDDVYAMY